MTEILLLLVVSALLVSTCFSMYRDGYQAARSTIIFAEERKRLKQHIADLERANTELESDLRNAAFETWDDTAFAITAQGVRALPKGWRAQFEKKKAKPAVKSPTAVEE